MSDDDFEKSAEKAKDPSGSPPPDTRRGGLTIRWEHHPVLGPIKHFITQGRASAKRKKRGRK